jgi:DNA-binding NarL/FixJ family response regulator
MRGGTLAAAIVEDTRSPESPQMLAIVADRRLSVAALSALLLRDGNYRIVREARGIVEVRESLAAFKPVVVVLEMASAPGSPSSYGAGLVGGWRTLLLLDPADGPAFLRAVRTHAHGYLSRSASVETLKEAVTRVQEAGSYLDPSLASQVLGAMNHAGAGSMGSDPKLSSRERDILVRIAKGLSTKQVARECAIAPKTVCNHVDSIYRKLNLRHRGQLVLYAAQQGLTSL